MSVIKSENIFKKAAFSRDGERHRKREALVGQASKLFNSRGLHGTRLEDIADSVGLTKTAVSYYFASKEELAAACYTASCDRIDTALNQVADKMTGAEKILAFFHFYANEWIDCESGTVAPTASISEVAALSDAVREEIGRRLSRSLGRFVDFAAEAIDEGALKARRPEPVAFLIMALVSHFDGVVSRLPRELLSVFPDALLEILSHGLFTDRAWRPAPAGVPAPQLEVSDIFDRQTRNALKREAFLKTAAYFFNQRGFKGVSLNAIAKELGVTRGAFYHHIPDKEHLLEQCFERSLTIVEDILERSRISSSSGAEILEKCVRALVQLQITGSFSLLRPNLLSALPADKRRPLETRLKGISGRLGDYVQQGISDGSVRRCSTDIVEQLLTVAVFISGGVFTAASGTGRTWRLSEDPVSASIDYARLLFAGAYAEKA